MQNQERFNYWKSHYDFYLKSGKSASQFSLDNKLNRSTFQSWKRRFENQDLTSGLVEQKSLFSEIQIPEESFLKVHIKYGGLEITSSTWPSANWLRELARGKK